jgi:hypothetical protein
MHENEHNLLIVGLPDAGKTSFIHSVDDVLQNATTSDCLRSYALATDRTYLEEEKPQFRAGKKLKPTDRTPQAIPPELLFEHPATGLRGRLFLPDLGGEIFQDQWIDRRWFLSYRDDLKKLSGALVFVRADVPAANQELLGVLAQFPKGGPKHAAFDPKKASPQAQIVDVLQFIAIKGEFSRPLKVAVMISAWDTVEKPSNLQPKEPAAFLAREWPLLDQYLECNEDQFTSRIYGVSALGGTEEELKGLRKLPPQDRVKIVDDSGSSKDLTRPLRWLLGLD